MTSKFILVLSVAAIVAFSSCKKSDKAPPPPKTQSTSAQQLEKSDYDACGLITKQEVETIEGSPVTDTKNSGHFDAGLTFAQCFYTTAEFSRSVSLAVTQPDPRATPKRNIKEIWEQTFGDHDRAEKEPEKESDKEKRESLTRQRGEREEERSMPPKKIEGVGEEAFWSATRVGGALYVLKKDAFIRISVGGPDPEEKKIEKCKALAQKALDRL